MKKICTILVMMVLFPVNTLAQTKVQDLMGEVMRGNVQIVSLTGTGGSSGAVLTGYLRNETATSKNINIYLTKPIYFENNGVRQNMLATRVFLSGGKYRTSGTQSFITLKPNELVSILFIAYCVDFEKDNPNQADSFTIGEVPAKLVKIADKIRKYEIDNENIGDVTAAAQIALWLTQGHSIDDIRDKFDFSFQDEMSAKSLSN